MDNFLEQKSMKIKVNNQHQMTARCTCVHG